MSETPVILHFRDALGRQQLADAQLIDGQTWRVNASVGAHRFARECGSWQAVERTLNWLRRHGHEADGRNPSPRAAVVAALAILLGGAAVSAQPGVPVSAAERQFTEAPRDYAWMHRRLEASLGPIETSRHIDTRRCSRVVDR